MSVMTVNITEPIEMAISPPIAKGSTVDPAKRMHQLLALCGCPKIGGRVVL